MKQRILINAFAIALFAAAGMVSGVRAQGQQPGAGMDVDVTVRAEESLTGPEQVSWVESQIGETKVIRRRVQSMLDQARREKDALKITCLDDKLTQLNVNLRGIEERAEAHRLAVQGGDMAAANQQFAILKIYISRVHGLLAEAENCVGDIDVVLGETETAVTIDDRITIEDPTTMDPEVEIGVEQPPHASGFY